ncbi:recombinase family protein [Cellulosimicrobium funkei]|nr:recombinase family protein [Cellulosimicrobium funkei]
MSLTEPVMAAIYARISQDKKVGTTEEGASTASQIDACRKFIKAQGWEAGEVYVDNSISATSGAVRPAFERLLEDSPSVVVAFKQDRLSRDLMDTLRIKTAGITGYLCDGGRLDFGSADSEMLTMIRSVVDSAEGKKKSERQKLATERDAKSGKYRGSIRPFGQTLTGERVEPEATAVQTAAQDLADGTATFWDIAKRWNGDGLKTPQTGKQGGKDWTSGTVRNYFTRPRLIGQQEYEGKLYTLNNWEPLLTAETFGHIQSLIESKKTGKRGVSTSRTDTRLLTAITQCECGRGMNAGQRGGAGSTRLYKCPTVKHQTVVAEPLERAVSLHALQLLSQSEDGNEEREEATQAIASLLDEKRVAESAHQEWITEAVEAGLSPKLISQKETAHGKRVSEIDAEVLRLRADLQATIFPKLGEDDLAGWETVSIAQRRDMLTSLFSKVQIARGGQGKRFSADRITYTYTDLGWTLYDRWAENNTVSPWDGQGNGPRGNMTGTFDKDNPFGLS